MKSSLVANTVLFVVSAAISRVDRSLKLWLYTPIVYRDNRSLIEKNNTCTPAIVMESVILLHLDLFI